MRPLNTLKKSCSRLLFSCFPRLRWAFLGEEKASRIPLKIDGRHVFILPTRLGFYVMTAIFILLVGAMNYNSNMTFLVTFLSVSILLLWMIETYIGLKGLTILGWYSPPVFAGESAGVRLNLRPNEGGLLSSSQGKGQLKCRFLGSSGTVAGEGLSPTISLETQERGYLTPGPLLIEYLHPSALFRAWSCPNPGIRILVFPAPLSYVPRRATERAPRKEIRVDERPFEKEPNHELSGIRPFVNGDPTRLIHWKRSFLGSGLQVKTLEEEGCTPQQYVRLSWWDLDGAGPEERLSRLTGGVLWCEENGVPYSLDLPGTHIETGLGEVHKMKALRTLALYGYEQKVDGR